MELTEQQKKDLKALKQESGFKVLEKIEEDLRIKLGLSFISLDLTNEANVKKIEREQIYASARRSFLNDIESHLREPYIPPLMTGYVDNKTHS